MMLLITLACTPPPSSSGGPAPVPEYRPPPTPVEVMPWWHSAADEGVVFRHVPNPMSPVFGTRLGAGLTVVDADLDGRDDLVMAAPSASLDGHSGFGDTHAFIVRGQTVSSGFGSDPVELEPMDVAHAILDGPHDRGFFAHYLDAHGDIAGNGSPALWVSGWSVGLPISGRHEIRTVVDWRYTVFEDYNDLWSTPFCGDVNDDGFDDYCSAQYGVHFGPLSIGETYEDPDILFGGEFIHADVLDDNVAHTLYTGRDTAYDNAGTVLLDHPPFTGEPDVEITGFDPGDKVGNWLSTGELTGDGIDDVFVASILDNEARGHGWIHDDAQVSGSLLDSTREFVGLYPSDALGKASVIADFDGDGFEDLAIGIAGFYGTHNRPGRVAVFAGPIEPGVYTEEDATRTWFGGLNDDDFGASLAVGDFDGDGLPDLAIGAPEDDRVQESGGVVYVLDDPLGRNSVP